jgi:periplasmic protein TonB
MNDPVDRVIVERERMDAGFPGSVGLSVVVHLMLVGAAFAAPLIFPPAPPLRVVDGFAVVLPRGGGGDPSPPAPIARARSETEAPPEAPAPVQPPPPVLKPPKEEPKTGLPDLNSKKVPKKAEKAPTPAASTKDAKAKPAASGPGGTGTSAKTPGLALGPPGPGVPEGTDSGGDWYLAGVQQKIWSIWTQQIKTGFSQPIGVTFTILADGSLSDVQVTLPSGVALLDLAAQRAVYSAGPFAPLPKEYGTNHYTIQALFKPVS